MGRVVGSQVVLFEDHGAGYAVCRSVGPRCSTWPVSSKFDSCLMLFIKLITGPMFSCIDITRLICRRLEACDVVELMKINKTAYRLVSSLLVGSVVGKREIRGAIDDRCVWIHNDLPLLDIKESFPAVIVSYGGWINMKRLYRIPELKAEMVYVYHDFPYDHPPRCVYAVDGCVKHIAVFEKSNDAVIYSLAEYDLKLFTLLTDVRILKRTYGRRSPALSAKARAYGATCARKATKSGDADKIYLGRLSDVCILSSKEFVQYIVGFD